MKRENLIGHWVTWPYSSDDSTRIEFDLRADGRFKGKVFTGDKVDGSAEGIWKLVGDSLEWTYKSTKNLPCPRRPELNKILNFKSGRFTLLEGSGDEPVFWRGGPCKETSETFELRDIRPLLSCVSKLIDRGFGRTQVAEFTRKAERLDVDERHSAVYPITFRGVPAPFYIHAFMDDIKTPDLYFSGPPKLVELIEREIEKLLKG